MWVQTDSSLFASPSSLLVMARNVSAVSSPILCYLRSMRLQSLLKPVPWWRNVTWKLGGSIANGVLQLLCGKPDSTAEISSH